MLAVRRREFITLLGGAGVTWPLAARAQKPSTAVVGYLGSSAPDANVSGEWMAALRHGLRDMGFIEGRNVTIETLWAEGQYDRLPALAADLIRKQVAVIAAFGPPAALAAKAATIPIVFLSGLDPVKAGLVSSLSQPGGNVTGFILFSGGLAAKLVQLVGELVGTGPVGMLVNPNNRETEQQVQDAREAARHGGHQLDVVYAHIDSDLDVAFAAFVQARVVAPLVGSDPFMSIHGAKIVALAARHAIPTVYPWREYVVGGRLNQLRQQSHRRVSASRHLLRPYSARRQPSRPAGTAADQIRAGDQPEDREGTRPGHSREPARSR